MPIELRPSDQLATRFDGDSVVVGLFEDGDLQGAAALIDTASEGLLGRLQKRGDLSGEAGRVLVLPEVAGLSPRVIAVGLGKRARFDRSAFVRAACESVVALCRAGAKHALTTLAEIEVPGTDVDWRVRQLGIQGDGASYKFAPMQGRDPKKGLESLSIELADPATLAEVHATNIGTELARDLGNLPPNICTPAYVAERCEALVAGHDVATIEVLEDEAMEALGMNALLAVARGSGHRPRLIVMRYTGAGDAAPQVLVGKGITFDSGGISLKPGAGMDEMKFDMCGAAAVIGAFAATLAAKPALNLVVIVPAVENMPDGRACRPGDVVKSMAGKTVEILNTDAEGRLVLCDALHYARRFEPATVIDIATLTGACVIALGKHAHGLFTGDDVLADELIAAGARSHDRPWRLPLWQEYQCQLDTGYADMANLGGKWAGAITAACFLARFTEDLRWAHVDIAGTAWTEGRKGFSTGRPVPLLVEWLRGRAVA